jgi:putative ABC transport system permease protein
MLDAFIKDLRFAARTLTNNPGFAAAAVLTLAVGIGATALVFSLVNAILLRPFPYDHPDRLVEVTESDRNLQSAAAPYSNYIDYRDGMRTLSRLAAYTSETFTVRGAAAAERVESARISYNLFDVLGVRPVLGRSFVAAEDEPNAPRVVLLSYGLWQRAFGGRNDVLGQIARVEGEPHTVVGVMPPDFKFPDLAEAWLPLREDPVQSRGHRYLRLTGRLTPGATIVQAQAEATTVAARVSANYPRMNQDRVVRVQTLRDARVGQVRTVLMIMLAAVAFVLLIACGNVANLLLSRAAARDREMAIRTALGAGRSRLVRQLLTESVLLGAAGAGLGVLFASWWMDLILAAIPGNLPFWMRFEIDGRVLLFTTALALATAFLFGLAPALQSVRADVQSTLREGRVATGSRQKNRLRNSLVVGQIALAMVLLAGGLLMARSFLAMNRVNPGFTTENILAIDLNLPGSRYEDPIARNAFYQRLLERVSSIPGIERAGAVSLLPIGGSNTLSNFTVEGKPVPERTDHAHHTIVTAGYFEAMDIPVALGRSFKATDNANSERVAIINRRLAEKYFGTENPLGRRINWGTSDDANEPPIWMTIIGVSGNVNQRDVNQTVVEPEIYQPYAQSPERGMSLVVRTEGSMEALLPVVRREVRALDGRSAVQRQNDEASRTRSGVGCAAQQRAVWRVRVGCTVPLCRRSLRRDRIHGGPANAGDRPPRRAGCATESSGASHCRSGAQAHPDRVGSGICRRGRDGLRHVEVAVRRETD